MTHLRSAVLRLGVVLTALVLASDPRPIPAAAAAPAALAEVDGAVITDEDLTRALGARLQKVEEQLYEMKRQKLEELIDERLLARAAATRGVTVDALLKRELEAKAVTVTDEEVDRFYDTNKDRLRGTRAELTEQIRGHLQIRQSLESQRLTEARTALLRSLRKDANVVVHLTEPAVVRVAVSTDGAPFQGSPNAPVTIVEFSDFHCPFCKRVLPVLNELRARYGDQVRLVFRDLPLDRLHPQARRAAEAARCAHDQDKFWAYHDVLFDNAPRASEEQLKAYARQVGLDTAAFDRCLASGKSAAVVQRDLDEGMRLGVSGTPHFFVNGRPLSGAVALERFVRVIDDELQRAR